MLPKYSKLTKAVEIINRSIPYVMIDEVQSVLQNLIDDGEYVKDWTAQEIADFVIEVME